MAFTPEYLARNGTEDGVQSAILQAVMLWIYPSYRLVELIYHVPNGGSRGANREEAQKNGAKMMALGTKAGTPDVCLPVRSLNYGALYIEVKQANGSGDLLPEQVNRLVRLACAGNMCAVIDDWMEGYTLIADYLSSASVEAFDAKWKITAVHNEHGDSAMIYDGKGYFAKYHRKKAERLARAAKKRAKYG